MLTSVPSIVQQMFQNEYGITVGYDPASNLLYQTGTNILYSLFATQPLHPHQKRKISENKSTRIMKNLLSVITVICLIALILFALNNIKKNQSISSGSTDVFKILNHPFRNSGKFVIYYVTALYCAGYGEFLFRDEANNTDSLFLLNCDLDLVMIDSSSDQVKLSYIWFKNKEPISPFPECDYTSVTFKDTTLVNIHENHFVMDADENQLFSTYSQAKVLQYIIENKDHINPWFYQQMKNFKGEIPFQTDKALIRE